MIIESIYIKNFRSIYEETLYYDNLTALVGANGSGKSNFLRALDLFYNPAPKIIPDDFYNGDFKTEVVIAVTYTELPEEAREFFKSYIRDNRLKVMLVFIWDGVKSVSKYHGIILQNPKFKNIRKLLSVSGKAREAKVEYHNVNEQNKYYLPNWSNAESAKENLEKWESENKELCEWLPDDGQFFGFKEVGKGYLGKFSKFLFIPAVKDASEDTSEGKGSVISELMDLVVRSVLANKEEIQNFKIDINENYKSIMDPNKLQELNILSTELTDTLKIFVPDAEVELNWLPFAELNPPMPQAEVKLIEDGYPSSVTRTGHGLQRAFILTLLQHLALEKVKANTISSPNELSESKIEEVKLSNLVIAIEEPELYQHPNRQRHLASILLQLAQGTIPGVAKKMQIIYATHSPLFVGIDRINQIRLIKKEKLTIDKPKVTKVISTNIDCVARKIWEANGCIGEEYNGKTILPRLKAIMTPWMNEGFFADVVVLVEGEEDRAAILGVSDLIGFDLEGNGFAVIPCQGKSNIDRPYAIFSELGIQIYVIWDSDYGNKEDSSKENRRLLRLLGYEEEDWPNYINESFACFNKKLEVTIKNEIGEELYDELLTQCQKEYSIAKRSQALKNPFIIKELLKNADKSKKCCESLKNIIYKIASKKEWKVFPLTA